MKLSGYNVDRIRSMDHHMPHNYSCNWATGANAPSGYAVVVEIPGSQQSEAPNILQMIAKLVYLSRLTMVYGGYIEQLNGYKLTNITGVTTPRGDSTLSYVWFLFILNILQRYKVPSGKRTYLYTENDHV